MDMNEETLSAAAMGIALSACCGFRVSIPMLIAGLSARFNMFQFSDSFTWLASTPALLSLGTASVLEIAAYYIPFIDNLLDSIAAPLSMLAGTLVATSLLPIDHEWLKWIVGIIAGGGGAGLIASGAGLLRLFSSKATLGTGNAVVATTENVSAIGGSILSLLIPVFTAIIFIIIFIYLMKKIIKNFRTSPPPHS